MRKAEFLDTTLRDSEQTPGVNFLVKGKIAIAKRLEKWGIASIEAGFPATSPDSFEAVHQVSATITTTAASGLAHPVKSDIDACYETLKDARYPQRRVFIATSPIHHEYKLEETKEEILDIIKEHVTYAHSRFDVAEFSPEGATCTEPDYLLQVVQTAVDADTTYINVSDTVGLTTPGEHGSISKYLIEDTKSDRETILGLHCHDDLGMATANALVVVKNGAGHVEGTVSGIGKRAGNVALKEIVVALNIHKDYYQATSDIVLNETINTSELISRFSGISIPKNKAVVDGNASSHEPGTHQDGALKSPFTYEIITPELVSVKHNSLPFGRLSGHHAPVEKLKGLELAFEESEIATLFGKFKKLADKKHEITDTDIRASVTGAEIENPEGLHFSDLKLASDIDNTVTARVPMVNTDGEGVEVIANGKGSVEAIYNAIDEFFNRTVHLLSYAMDAITNGIDSQARVSVSIEDVNIGAVFDASGIDFDVLKASAVAYISANASVQKENADKISKAVSLRDVPTN